MKETLSQAIERWETDGGASQDGPQQGPARLHPNAAKDATFAGDFLEHPGFVGEMRDQWEAQ